MSLKYLLDENISHSIAAQVRNHSPEIEIVSIHHWREGVFLSQRDDALLKAAVQEGLTLVTYDQNTIPPLFFEFVQSGQNHGGVIFNYRHTLASNDFGGLVRALLSHWQAHQAEDWTNQVAYLTRA